MPINKLHSKANSRVKLLNFGEVAWKIIKVQPIIKVQLS